jgi:Cytochrome c554 and c-prime
MMSSCATWLQRRSVAIGVGTIFAIFIIMHTTLAFSEKRTAKIVGSNACAECHKGEATVWKGTHHFSTFREMPRSKAAREIASKMKVRRIKANSLCVTCHFTQQTVKNRTKVTSGISCESCHGAGRDWQKIHSEFSGKGNKDSESKAESAARWKKSERLGMIRPAALYKLAKNCFGCHVVPKEDLVNIGGHAAGSPFELVAWSQGEVRHNVWYSKGKRNTFTAKKRKRMMYVIGIAVEVETALRAIAVATKKKDYAIRMAHRADRARQKMAVIAAALPQVQEFGEILSLSHSAGLKLNNKVKLNAAADSIAKAALQILAKYDGATFDKLDKFLPVRANYKGQPSKIER